MKSDKIKLQHAVKFHYSEKSLYNKQQHDLKALQKKLMINTDIKQNNFFNSSRLICWMRYNIFAPTMAITLMAAVFIFNFYQEPTIISAAYADVIQDKGLTNGLDKKSTDWMTNNQLLPVTDKFKVRMSKFCNINNNIIMHLRIDGKKKGAMNVFFHKSKQSITWKKKSGKKHKMQWKLIEVKEDLSLIEMYTSDMRQQSVDVILNAMLKELVA